MINYNKISYLPEKTIKITLFFNMLFYKIITNNKQIDSFTKEFTSSNLLLKNTNFINLYNQLYIYNQLTI